jgi:RNA polymerase sigma-70 factor, ECF subfamily
LTRVPRDRTFWSFQKIKLVVVNGPTSPRNREVMEDDELINRLSGGDDVALRELFSRHAPMLAARLRAVLPAADVEDVLQETFIAAWHGAHRYEPRGVAGGWLWGIARRQAALMLRRRGPVGNPLSDGDAVDWESAADPANTAALRADIDAAIAELGPPGSREREVWRLMYVEQKTVEEIAGLTGVPEGTVKSRAHRARRLLRAVLGQENNFVIEGGS